MRNDGRFEICLPTSQLATLSQLSEAAGVSRSGLVRLALRRLLEDQESILRSTKQPQEAA